MLINSDRAAINRINFLLQNEVEVKSFSLGKSPIDKNALKMTIRYYEQLQKYASASGIIYGNLGFCYYYLGDYPRALEAYRRAIILEPVFGALQWDLAMILFERGNMKEAVDIWENYLNEQELMQRYFAVLRGQTERAGHRDALSLVEALEKRFMADQVETYIKLSEAFYLLKDYSKARTTAIKGLGQFPNNRWLNFIAGQCAFLQGHLRKAAEYFGNVIAGNAQDINAYYYHALCMNGLGDIPRRNFDYRQLARLRAQKIEPLPLLKNDARLHFNTEMLLVNYYLVGSKKNNFDR